MTAIPTRKIILLGIVVFLLGLLVKLPASVVLPAGAGLLPGTSISQASGSAWNGKASGVTVAGRRLDSVEWDLAVLRLLLLQLSADVSANVAGDRLSARVTAGLDGRIEVHQLRGSVQLASLEQLRLLPRGMASGEVLLDIEQLLLDAGKPVEATGRAQLAGLRSGMLPGVALGNYAGTLQTNEQGIRLDFRDTEAPLELQGSATLLPDGSYRSQGTVRPTGDSPQQLREGMKFLGPQDDSGRYRFSFNGRL